MDGWMDGWGHWLFCVSMREQSVRSLAGWLRCCPGSIFAGHVFGCAPLKKSQRLLTAGARAPRKGSTHVRARRPGRVTTAVPKKETNKRSRWTTCAAVIHMHSIKPGEYANWEALKRERRAKLNSLDARIYYVKKVLLLCWFHLMN